VPAELLLCLVWQQ